MPMPPRKKKGTLGVETDGRYTIEVVAVALEVMDHLVVHAGNPQRPSDVARDLGINRTRAFRILKTLEQKEYALVDPETGRWQLSLKCLEIGERLREKYDIRQIAAPFVTNLARQTGEMVEIVMLYDDEAVIIDGRRGGHRLQVTSAIGLRFPLHVGASPKLLLAHLPREERERRLDSMQLPPFTLKTIVDKGELRRRLEEIQAQGFSIDEGEYEEDIRAVAAPIRDHKGQVVAGVTVSLPATRFHRQRRIELIRLVVDTAAQINARHGLGH